jgi:F-type H+-transporting ATPase subunit gamma
VPNLRDLRRRITSVKNTQQITKAMKMVAAAKLRRAQEAVESSRPFAQNIRRLLENLAATEYAAGNPYFARRPEERIELLAFSSDRGLCGAFNSNIIKRVHQFVSVDHADEEVSLTLVGRKAYSHFQRRGYNVRRGESALMNRYAYEDAAALADEVIGQFLTEQCDAVYGLYVEFRSAISQRIRLVKLLPIEPVAATAEETAGTDGAPGAEYLFEPEPARLLQSIIPRTLKAQVYLSMLETSASEHGSRMTAMDNATNNAKEMIDTLTLRMNKARQAGITTEIIEIVSGAEALG